MGVFRSQSHACFARGRCTASGLMNVYLSECVESLDLANATTEQKDLLWASIKIMILCRQQYLRMFIPFPRASL